MKINGKKLTLSKQTLRRLDDEALAGVGGGTLAYNTDVRVGGNCYTKACGLSDKIACGSGPAPASGNNCYSITKSLVGGTGLCGCA